MARAQRKLILVVEDDEMVREIITWALEDLGFEVVGASAAAEALDVLSRVHVDLLLTDIRMPGGMDGWTLAEKARALFSDIPVIYVSGYTEEPPRPARGGIFMQKPLRTEMLRSALQELGLL